MHAHVHRPCCQLQQARPLARCCRQVRSVNRRDILVSTVSLVSAAEAVASETEPGASPEGAAAAAAADSLAGGLAAAAAATRAAKPQKKKSKGKARAKAALKPPGIVPKVKLADNLAVSKVIRGCWQLDGQHKGDALSDRTSGAAAIEDLDAFCRAGITTIDTADNYGGSELLVGQHLRLNPEAAFNTQVATKLSFMTPPAAIDLRRDNIEYRVRSSIARMGVTSIDLLQLHWEPPPAATAAAAVAGSSKSSSSSKGQPPPGFVVAAKVLKQLQQEGLIKQLGVSNFDVPMLMALLDAGVKPVSNQVSYSVVDRRPQLFLSRFCEARGIALLAYGTLAGGFLAERYRELPADKARIDTMSKARYGTLLRQLGGWSWMQDVLQVLHDIGEKHGVSASCVAGRWVLQQPGVSAIVLGARNATHLRDAQRLFSPEFELDEEDLFDLDAVYEGASQPTTDVYVWERGGEW